MTFTCPKIPNICEKLLNVGGDWMDPTCDVFSTWHCPERDHLWCLFCSSSLLGDAVTGVWGPSVSEGSQLTRSRPPPVPRSRPCSRYQPQFLNLWIPPTHLHSCTLLASTLPFCICYDYNSNFLNMYVDFKISFYRTLLWPCWKSLKE